MMTVKAGDTKWAVATKSGSPKRFAREVTVTRLIAPVHGGPFDCEIEDPDEGHRAYAIQKNLFDSRAEAEKEAAKGAKPSIVLLGSVRLEASQRLLATRK